MVLSRFAHFSIVYVPAWSFVADFAKNLSQSLYRVFPISTSSFDGISVRVTHFSRLYIPGGTSIEPAHFTQKYEIMNTSTTPIRRKGRVNELFCRRVSIRLRSKAISEK
jgi:hypothetical protein